jgi:hypothetical protein
VEAGAKVNEVTDYSDTGGLDARDGVVYGVEFGLVVAEIENRGNAAGERGKHREIDHAGAAAGDDVAVFERVAVDDHGQRHAGVRGAETVHGGDELRGAFIGGVLISHDEEERFGRRFGGAQTGGEDEENDEGEAAHDDRTVGPACGGQQARRGRFPV